VKKLVNHDNNLLSKIIFTLTYRGHDIIEVDWDLEYTGHRSPYQLDMVYIWKNYEDEDIEIGLKFLLVSSFILSLGMLAYSLLNASIRSYGKKE